MRAYHQSLSRRTTTAFCAFLLCNAVAYATGFEDKCGYESGSAIVRIGLENALPIVDQSKSAHELGRLVAHAKGYKHIGLTEALLQRRFAVSLNGFVDPKSSQACGKPIIEMRLRYDPLRIYLASELDNNECAQEEVLDHELEHIRLYISGVEHAAMELRQEILARYSYTVLQGTEQEILKRVEREIRERWLPRLDLLLDQYEWQHEVLDRAAAAHRSTACQGVFEKIVRRIKAFQAND
jgi:hypothetical protein